MSDVRINLLKEVKSAVNTASFAPTAERIADAKRMVSHLMSYVESLEEGLKKPKRRKTTKQKSGKATAATRIADRQERAFHGKADTPVTPRHTKRTASVEEARKAAQEVSDKTGATARAKRKAEALKKAVVPSAPVTSPKRKPSKKAKNWTKGVEERTTLVETTFLPTPVTSPDEARLADLEAKIEALLALQAMGHDVMRNENEVLFSDLPFDPDFNHYEG